jgi:hypothetical protein
MMISEEQKPVGEGGGHMWQLCVAEAILEPFRSEQGQVTINTRSGYIRDGTPGISLTIGGEIVGEWTDSGAKSLSLDDDCNVVIYGGEGNARCLLIMPGRAVRGEELSETEVAITVQV